MGRRVPPWATEENFQGYQADPNLPRMWTEMGDKQLQTSEELNRLRDEASERRNQMRLEGSKAIAQGLSQGVESGLSQYGQAKERKVKQAEFERQGRLTEEQLAASKQQREIAAQEEQRRQERSPLEMEGLKSQTDVAKAQASRMSKEEEFENGNAVAEDALPGETNRAYKARKEIETVGYNSQTARQQLAVQEQQIRLAEQQLAQAKDMAPLEKDRIRADIAARKNDLALSQRNIAELDRQKSVKDATNILQAEMSSIGGDPAKKQERIAMSVAKLKEQGVPAAHIAEAINNANASEAQKAFMAKQIDMMDPEKQYTVQNLLQGKKDYTTFKQATNDMQNAYERYKNSSWAPDTEGKAATEQFAKALEAAGENELANDIRSQFDPSRALQGKSPIGREDRMAEIIATVQNKWGQRLKALEKDDPRFGKMGEEIANMKYTPIRGRNIVNDWFAPAQTMNAGQPQQPATTVELQGMPGVKVNYPKPQVGNR